MAIFISLGEGNMKIYTKTGDQGYTSTLGGKRVKKSDPVIALQGTVDEVNGNLGYLAYLCESQMSHRDSVNIVLNIRKIQKHLFLIGSDISSGFTKQGITDVDVKYLEDEIDRMTETTGSLNHFIFYSGCGPATYGQVVRSVVRRADRCFVEALGDSTYPQDYQYINRLADYLFELSRYINVLENAEEIEMK